MTEPTAAEIATARSIAGHLVALGGPDLRHLDDAQLIAHITTSSQRLAAAARSTAVTLEEATRAFTRFTEALRNADLQSEKKR